MTTILFVDDEPRIRQFCKEELEREGFCIVLAEDGEDAIEAVHVLSIDLVILDEHMKWCGGFAAAQRIRQISPGVPILLFTTDRSVERRCRAIVDAIVVKSADLSTLKTVIHEILQQTHNELPAPRRPGPVPTSRQAASITPPNATCTVPRPHEEIE